jgi:hypothetical protein
MEVPRALKRRSLQVGLLAVFLLLTGSFVLIWGRQKWTRGPSEVSSERESKEFSTQLSEQAGKKAGKPGQTITRERVQTPQQHPPLHRDQKDLRARMRRKLYERQKAFPEMKQVYLERLKGLRSQSGARLKNLEQPEEKPGTAAQAETGQLGKEKSEAAEGLKGADSHTVIDKVMTALNNPDPEVRQEALEALEDVGDEAINGPLLKALADENPDVRESAMDLMNDIESPIILPSLEQVLVAGDEDMRAVALSILEDIPDPRAVDLIIEKGLLNYNNKISQEAYDSLEWITDQEFKSYDEARKWWDANRDTFNFD